MSSLNVQLLCRKSKRLPKMIVICFLTCATVARTTHISNIFPWSKRCSSHASPTILGSLSAILHNGGIFLTSWMLSYIAIPLRFTLKGNICSQMEQINFLSKDTLFLNGDRTIITEFSQLQMYSLSLSWLCVSCYLSLVWPNIHFWREFATKMQ